MGENGGKKVKRASVRMRVMLRSEMSQTVQIWMNTLWLWFGFAHLHKLGDDVGLAPDRRMVQRRESILVRALRLSRLAQRQQELHDGKTPGERGDLYYTNIPEIIKLGSREC